MRDDAGLFIRLLRLKIALDRYTNWHWCGSANVYFKNPMCLDVAKHLDSAIFI